MLDVAWKVGTPQWQCHNPDTLRPVTYNTSRAAAIPEEGHEAWQDNLAHIDGSPGFWVCPPKRQQHVPHGRMHCCILLINKAQDLWSNLLHLNTTQSVWRPACIHKPTSGAPLA